MGFKGVIASTALLALALGSGCGEAGPDTGFWLGYQEAGLNADRQTVRDALTELNSACEAVATLVPAGDSDQLPAQFSKHVGWFWHGLYSALQPTEAVSEAPDRGG